MSNRIAQVLTWLVQTPASDTEDRVFRLRALQVSGAAEEFLQQAVEQLVATQQPDGGWAQTEKLSSDAYATGSALAALQQAGKMEVTNASYRRGLQFLVSSQQADGSWHVISRSDPFQTYFESGYPHGKDQFISISAAGWATMALALALPETDRPPAR